MAESQRGSEKNSKTDIQKRILICTIIILVVTIIGVVIAFCMLVFGQGLVPKFQSELKSKQPPKFDFQFEGVLDNDNPVYEVTEDLAYIGSLLGTIEIIVSADYSGNEISDPVVIQIQSDEVARWDDFQYSNRDSKLFNLTPSDLFNYSGIPARVAALNLTQSDSPAATTSGQFKIVVMQNNDELANKTITVVHTPWVHTTQLSHSSIVAGENITAYVTVKNRGEPSNFNVVGLLYETTSSNTSTFVFDDDGWWAEQTWGKDKHRVPQETDTISKDEECTVPLPIPKDKFEAQHTYMLQTNAVKKLPYLKFTNSDWLDSWNACDPPHYSTIVVLAEDLPSTETA